jgi:hypothetical protein
MHRNSAIVSTKQKRIAAGAKRSSKFAFISLAYLMDIDWLKEAYRRTRKDGAVGVDRVASVIGFRDGRDAQRVLEVIPQRFGKYGLTVHPTKTKLVRFRPPSSRKGRNESLDDRLGTFDLLGFTHYWARSRNGYWVVKLKTATDRFTRAVRSIDHWCRDNRHLPIGEQHKKLNEKLRGHYAYYGVTGNSAALARFLHEFGPCWRQWLNRRNNFRSMRWE